MTSRAFKPLLKAVKVAYNAPMQLHDELTKHFRLVATQKKALEKLGVRTVRDLLFHFPNRYEDVGSAKRIAELVPNEIATVYGKLSDLKKTLNWKTKKYMVEAKLTDETGSVKIRWFNQPYAADMFEHVQFVRVTGKPTLSRSARGQAGTTSFYFANPNVESVPALPDIFEAARATTATGGSPNGETMLPTYPESKGVTSRWLYHALQKVLAAGVAEQVEDPVPEDVRKKYSLPSLSSALVWLHAPRSAKESEAARKRIAFDEVFAIQIAKQQSRAQADASPSIVCAIDEEKVSGFVDALPYTLTSAQQKAVAAILSDFATQKAMSRLLEGDVGSGKTAVAAVASFAIATGKPETAYANPQTAYMAPTEILAKQQFDSFVEFFKDSAAHSGAPMQIGLLTSSGCKKFPSKTSPTEATNISKAQLLKWIANGEINVVVGTHALIQKAVQFKNLAFVIIDEQHRFGTNQRKALARGSNAVPHLLSMSATPIPRTLALTIYGDLDISVLDELPAGRKVAHTKVVPEKKREEVHAAIRMELARGKQAYVICPRIEEPDPAKALALRVKSVEEEAKKIDALFPDARIDTLHGKKTPKEKEEVMHAFEQGEIDILVATTVVEVGVNVPNATVIVIEGAERFGLAQLHQLRGRVQRSSAQPYCYLFVSTNSPASLKRIRVLEKATDGFLLAEEDLNMRGAGELAGASQWGISDIGMEALRNIKMVEAARESAKEIVANDPTLAKHPALREKIARQMSDVHLE